MASASFKVESGIQVLTRLIKKTAVGGFYPIIFESGPRLEDIIEIYSDNSVTCFLADLICEAIIPNYLNGVEASVIVFNTDGKLTADFIMNFAKHKLINRIESSPNNKSYNYDLSNLDYLLNSMLKNLYLLEIYDTTQFYTSIQNLENILMKNSNISLIIFDTLTAFYWDEQTFKITRMDLYVKKLLWTIKKVTKDFKVTVIYTRPEYFSSSKEPIDNLEHCCESSVVERINYRIQIVYSENENYINVRTFDKVFKRKFNIFNNEIIWL